MAAYLEQAPDAVIIHDAKGRILYVNAQFEHLFGYSRSDVLGQSLEILMPQRFRDRHVEHRAGYRDEPHVRPMGTELELYAQRADGTEFPVDIAIAPVDLPEGVRYAASVRDVSKQKGVVQAMQRRLAAEREAVAFIKKANQLTMEWATALTKAIEALSDGEGPNA